MHQEDNKIAELSAQLQRVLGLHEQRVLAYKRWEKYVLIRFIYSTRLMRTDAGPIRYVGPSGSMWHWRTRPRAGKTIKMPSRRRYESHLQGTTSISSSP
jgi:hypothetical protein